MTIKKISIFYFLLLFVSFAFSSDVNQLPATLEYKLDLRIDYVKKKLYGKCKLTILNRIRRSFIEKKEYQSIPIKDYGIRI